MFETNYIGSIQFAKNGVSKVEILKVNGSEALKSVKAVIGGRNLRGGWCSFMTQRQMVAWTSFVVHKPFTHWRYRLQFIALTLCEWAIRFIGRPLLSLAPYDKGFTASLFAKIYCWIVGDSYIPNLGPIPDTLLLALDLKSFRFKHVPFQVSYIQ